MALTTTTPPSLLNHHSSNHRPTMSTGLPRFSALPQPRTGRHGSVDSGGSSGSTGLPAPGRMSAMSNRQTDLSAANAPTSPQNNRRSMLVQPGQGKTPAGGVRARPQSMMPGFGGVTGLPRSPPRPAEEFPETVQEVDSPSGGQDAIGKPNPRRTRPSLSDRTIETLAQVPPTPSPAKQRRQSAFYQAEGPASTRPLSRAGSSLGMRPGSRIGAPSGIMSPTFGRPVSPSKVPAATGLPKQPMGLSGTTRRSVSDKSSAAASNGLARTSSTIRKPATGLQQPGQTARPGLARPAAGRGLATPAKSLPTRPAGARSPVKDIFGPEIQKPRAPVSGIKSLRPPATRPAGTSLQTRAPGLRPPGSRVLPKTRPTAKTAGTASTTVSTADTTPLHSEKADSSVPPSLASTSGDESSMAAAAEELSPVDDIPGPEDVPEIEEEKTPRKASQSLRDMIAAGRAAKMPGNGFTPRFASSEMDDFSAGIGIAIGPDTDPNSFNMEDSRFINVLKKRVNAARTDGKLNISALGLSEVPAEVLNMYDYDPDNQGGVAFYEMVEVTRLQAADNEIEELPKSAFVPLPDESDTHSGQPAFSSLENIDFHGNKLRCLHPRLSGLDRLTVLNLSRNHLGFDAFDVISKLPALADLKMADNGLKGPLPACIGDLAELEVLDLHGNSITELPRELGNLNKLKRLNVADNRLDAIPFDAIFDLPLVEILANRNRLNGALFPNHVTQVPHLRTLDVSTNALIDISEEKIALPALQVLNIANNRIAALPSVIEWKELSSLNVEENKISAFPEGFVDLKKLQTANFSNNSLLTLDSNIGNMESLSSLQLTNNPIRERKFTRLGTEEVKAELRLRLQPQSQDQQQQPQELGSPSKARFSLLLGGGANGGSVIGPGKAWTAAGGLVDKSNSKLRDIETAQIEGLAGQGVHTLSLHHNWLPQIPATIGLLGAHLTTLDLSNNRLNKTTPFVGAGGQPLHLPNLDTLNLTSNGLTTLDALAAGNLLAPKLAILIVPFNRLTRLPAAPPLRDTFPQLTKLIAGNNVIEALDVEAVRGLHALDVSSNEITALPAQLGALQGSLRTLMVNGNRFRVPGWGVLEKGTEEVLRWCRMKIPAGEEGSLVADAIEEDDFHNARPF